MKYLTFLLLAMCVLIFCGERSALAKEENFYNAVFDSLYNVLSQFSVMKNEDNIRIMTQHLSTIYADFVETKKQLGRITTERTKNRKELFRFANAAEKAGDVFASVLEQQVYQYIEKWNVLDTRIENALRFRDRYRYLVYDEMQAGISRLRKEQSIYQDSTLDGARGLADYIEAKKDSLREVGWLRYLEWRKYNKDVEPTGEIDW